MKHKDILQCDKYEITTMVEKFKSTLNDPTVPISGLPQSIYDEVMNMPVDKDGCIPIYYLSDGLKSLLSIVDLFD
ncbi:hypothetical protein [Peribacillus loiseleuriae]|uniref:hypothetical protein n=1 Tax=Peribacillus loiseleuriae TaxID=1679170 RepID=UPI003D00639C